MRQLGLSTSDRDASAEAAITIEEPRLAYVNLSDLGSLPTSKWTEEECWLEFHGAGTYFRKRITIKGQGGYSIRYPKKNFSFQLYEDDWSTTTDLTIGRWVEQDAFHLKAFWTDYFRGIGEIGYKAFEGVVADRRPYWERGGYVHESLARCFPDGFPCILYVNGEFYGIYAWQLKKHRKNMNQKKKLATHIHLDGNLSDKHIFRGKITWKEFEVRTPKGLIDNKGVAYDGNKPNELMDENSSSYNNPTDTDSLREVKLLTAQTKKHIVAMSRYWSELDALEKEGAMPELMRQEIEERYDTEALTDYAVHYYFTSNGDGSLKNWQWFTYDGKRWAVTPYDLDQTFGIGLYGNLLPPYYPFARLTSGPFYWIDKYYADDIADRYAMLRQNCVLDYDNVTSIIDDWHQRVGDELYATEKQHWPNSPCYRDAVCNTGWEACSLDDPEYHLSGLETYNNSYDYRPGDVCWLEGRLWRATDFVTGVKPFIINANRDSMERLHNWVKGRIEFLDAYFAYDDDKANVPDVASKPSERRLEAIYTLQGIRVDTPIVGQTYIFRYNNGTSRKVLVR